MSLVTDIASDAKMRKMSARGGDGKVGDLLRWNNLRYQMPVTNSVVSARNIKRYPADRASYDFGTSGQSVAGPIFFHIQSGEHYIDWAKSFIELKLTANLTSTALPEGQFATFGIGSICNLIDEVIVSTRSGTEIYRCEEFGRWRAMRDTMTRNPDWFDSVGALMGYSNQNTRSVLLENVSQVGYRDLCHLGTGTTGVVAADARKIERTFCIPLDMLGGPFATGQLSPAVLAGGLVIELRLAALNQSFTAVACSEGVDIDDVLVSTAEIDSSSPTTIGSTNVFTTTIDGVPTISKVTTSVDTAFETDNKLSQVFIHLDTHLLNDQSMRSLTQTASSKGLEITYESQFHQQASSQGNSLDVVCSKAVSRALTVFGAFYPSDSDSKNTNVDRFMPLTGDKIDDYQWRLGSQYFPHVKLSNTATMYHNLLYTLETIDDDTKHFPVTLKGFENGLQVSCATFERSSLLKYSGSAINNSRTLSLSLTKTTTNSVHFHFWLSHLTVAKTFLNNCVVSI